MSQDPDQKFFDVLAGRAPPDDADSRLAARLKQYFEMHPTLDERPRRDPQGEAQLLAYLAARRAAAPAVVRPAVAQAEAGWLQRALRWAFPAEGGAGLRQAGLALGVVGLATAVLVGLQRPAEDDVGMKGAPPIPAPAPGAVPPGLVLADDPAAAVAELQTLLLAQGVPSNVTPQADGSLLLQADVPAARQSALDAPLGAKGVVLPADGRLAIIVKRAP